MNKFFSHKYNKQIISLMPGEYEISDNDVLSTVLGTCIAVILYSEKKKIGGMNHFMLPKSKTIEEDGVQQFAGKYGIQAMELLINAMMKRGIKKSEMTAKVFGGGSMFANKPGTLKPHVGLMNIDFAVYYLEEERIPIIGQDTGGAGGRKVLFFPENGKVLMSKVGQAGELMDQEDSYSRKISGGKQDDKDKKIILF